MPTPTALLVIDVQIGMFDGLRIPPVHRGEELLATITGLLEQARAAGVPVVFVQHMGGAGHPLAPDAPGNPLHPALAPQPGELIVQKTTPDSFHQTDLRERLDALGARTLVVVGIQTDQCVDTTTRRAASLGYDVRLVSDGHSTWDSGALTAAQIIAHHNLALGGWFATPIASGELDFDELAAPPHVGRTAFHGPSVNYYVADVEAAARFYTQHLGFRESFRTPSEGEPVHVEVRLGDLVLGLAARSAGEATHGLPLGQGGPPRAEVVVWTDDVDAAYAALVADGVPSASAPHDFLGALRAAWVLDPDGNPVEIVSRIAAPPARV